VAVFIDGCFWHGCPDHGTWPKSNAGWWRDKIEQNRARDEATDAALANAGWLVVRAWEHEDPLAVAARVSTAVRSRRD
jgi:DNA mismatch endonuclease (patch repair protein)